MILGIVSTYLASMYLGAIGSGPPSRRFWLALLNIDGRVVRESTQSVEFFARLSLTDDLTGLGNDRSFRATLSELVKEVDETRPLGLILVDLDQFKSYNDAFGHPGGDDVLREIGIILREKIGAESHVFRLGGDEFAILLPGREESASLEFAAHLRDAIEAHPWPLRAITASLGVVSVTRIKPEMDPSVIVGRADRALYRAKRDGRNRAARHSTEELDTE